MCVSTGELDFKTNTYPARIRVKLPSAKSGLSLFDDQQCTGKRSKLDATLSTLALKYKILFSGIGLRTLPV